MTPPAKKKKSKKKAVASTSTATTPKLAGPAMYHLILSHKGTGEVFHLQAADRQELATAIMSRIGQPYKVIVIRGHEVRLTKPPLRELVFPNGERMTIYEATAGEIDDDVDLSNEVAPSLPKLPQLAILPIAIPEVADELPTDELKDGNAKT